MIVVKTPRAVGTRRLSRAQRWGGLAALGAAVLLVAFYPGGGDSGAGIIKKADEFLRSGDHEMALKHYRLISESHPGSEYAARALFQQGIILNTHLKKPKQALIAYELLVKNHPDSDLADDSLMAIGAIHSDAHEGAEALKAFREAAQLFASNRDVCADAHVAIGRILFHQGDPKAIDELNLVLREYRDKTSRCAEAQYRLGQCYQEIQRHNERAVKAYQAVLDEYADSQFAESARQAIGFIYYGIRKAEEEQGKRVDLEAGLKPLVNEEGNGPFIESLRVCLAVRGVRASGSQLAGLTGLAFENHYSRDPSTAPLVGPLSNPFERVCSAYGLRYEQVEARDAAEAWTRMRQALDEGRPLIALVRGSALRWSAIVGYHNKTQQILARGEGASIHRIGVAELEKMLQRPPHNLADSPPPTWAKFVFYGIGGVPRGAQRKRSELRSLKAAVEALQGGESGKTARGLKAYQELRTELEEVARDGAGERKAAVIGWGQHDVVRLRAMRRSGVAYLRSLQKDFNASDRGRILEAAEALAQSENLLGKLQAQLVTLDSTAESPETSMSERAQQAIDTVTDIINHERQAADALAAVVGP